VQLSSGVLAPAHPHIKAGTIKALAVTGRTRWHDLPEIPTMLESGTRISCLKPTPLDGAR
jgi:tripartite-type tricarboxylate transporter receptor subunit TctC